MPDAGRLKSGANYIYERADGKVYAREHGSTERILIGEDYNLDVNHRNSQLFEEWLPVLQAAEQNPALQDALARVKLVYELSRTQDPLFHHPV